MNSDLINLIKIIIGSSITTVITEKIFNSFMEKKRKKEESYKRLYGPLRFYLSLLDSIDTNKKELKKIYEKASKEHKLNVSDDYGKAQIQEDINEERRQKLNELTKRWWLFVEKIKELIENNPEYIKKRHFDLIINFFEAYIKRELVGKKNMEFTFMPWEDYKDYGEELIKAIEELKKLF
ncbi:MAG: hypothetical protein QXU40_01880 [Candidatus Pacearchaeota archaeon]